jgi:ABC-type phosphate transport system permease subunit
MVTLHLANVKAARARHEPADRRNHSRLMSVPVIVSLSEDALRACRTRSAKPRSRWARIRGKPSAAFCFPAARNGLLAACLLGMGRAIGETMAVLLATGHNLRIPHSLTDPVRTMTATIAAEMGETVTAESITACCSFSASCCS